MTRIAIIGAGPAGLTAAYLLAKEGIAAAILEKDPGYVGGISRTVRHKGFCFDIGGHRFFSKSAEVEALWDEILGGDFLTRPRASRIFFGGKFYPYPLEAWHTLRQIGPVTAGLCVISYLKARLFPRAPVKSFEDWVINRFGERLFRMFFKTYTEKVWGMDCKDISADWAAQRIRGLSLTKAILHALTPRKIARADRSVKTLIHSFRYPRKGPGMMWEAAAAKTRALGGAIHQGMTVTSLRRGNGKWQAVYQDAGGKTHSIEADHVISSMPLRDLVLAVDPPLPREARAAAAGLAYRDFLIVALIVRERGAFDDNWLYIHEPGVRVGRIQNFKSWSPEMVPDPALNCYGMEYFCFEGDGLWASADETLVALASRELASLGLARSEDIIEGIVVRQPKAYPVYDEGYKARLDIVRRALAEHCPNLHVTGRGGMHQYNNQDHAMMTAMLTVKNILSGEQRYDVWNVNQDAEYHETLRDAPQRAD